VFDKQIVTFRFFATSPGMAENVAKVLRSNAGQNLRELGMVHVDSV
jgi:hypothetical protein